MLPAMPARSASATLLRGLAIWGVWLAIALVTSLQNYAVGLAGGTPQPWLPALVNGLIWYSAWAVLTPGVVAVARRFAGERRIGRLVAIHAVAGVCFATLHAALYASGNAIVFGRMAWAPWSSDLLLLKLTSSIHVHLMIYAIIVGIVMGARAYRTLRDRELAAARLETRLAEAETAALRAQLQPHFLFNTLNAISALVPEDPLAAQRLIARLGDLLRLSIEQHRGQQSSLADELDFTDAYLAIEQARLGDRLRIARRITPEALAVQVPTLLLQPLVENAVRHGIAPGVAGGTLAIEAALAGERLRLVVADDGRGAAQVIEGVGLDNARQRLRQLHGERQSLAVETAPGKGFRVTIEIPR
jgi:signal transduction histidine kinase